MVWRLRVKNPDGSVQFDSTTPLGRIIGIVPAFTSGSINVPGFAEGIPWAVIVGGAPPAPMSAPPAQPTVTISGTTLSWTVVEFPLDCDIWYGTY